MNQNSKTPIEQQRIFLKKGIWPSLIQTIESTVRRSGHELGFLTPQRFVDGLHRWSSGDIALLQTALELLYARRGQVSMTTLATHCCLSLRQFERRFQRSMGISPKVFARLLRFETARDVLIQSPSTDLKEIASQCGYQDQAHLTHEFKTWSGCTPGMFLMRLHRRTRSGYILLPDLRSSFRLFLFQEKG